MMDSHGIHDVEAFRDSWAPREAATLVNLIRLKGRSSSRARGAPDPAPTESYSRCVDRPASRATIALCAMIKAFADLCQVGGLENNRCIRPSS